MAGGDVYAAVCDSVKFIGDWAAYGDGDCFLLGHFGDIAQVSFTCRRRQPRTRGRDDVYACVADFCRAI